MLEFAARLVMLFVSPAAPVPDYWGALDPGPYAVGFSQEWVTDSTRRLPRGEQSGTPFRPILLNLWYPAAREGARPMRYDDYFEGAVRAAAGQPGLASYAARLVAYQRDISWGELAGAERDSTPADLRQRIDGLLNGQAFAFRDAPRSTGAMHVVVYTSGAQSSMDDNVVLCEYLASMGYLVIGSAFPQEDNTSFATNGGDQSRQRDIRRLLLEVARMPGVSIASVTAIGHSMGAQAMQLFAADPSAPIDAVISLDTTQDYVMLTDGSWAWYTDVVIDRREEVSLPIMFVAGPTALFELADSLVASPRTLVTVPDLRHNDFISQGVIRKRLLAGLPGDDRAVSDAASRAYESLVEYIGSWLDARSRGNTGRPPVARSPVEAVDLPPGPQWRQLEMGAPVSARHLRHMYRAVAPDAFAGLAVQARTRNDETGDDSVLMMLLADDVRSGSADHARLVYRALLARDASVRRIPEVIEARARLFESIGATVEAEEWRSLLVALEGIERSSH